MNLPPEYPAGAFAAMDKAGVQAVVVQAFLDPYRAILSFASSWVNIRPIIAFGTCHLPSSSCLGPPPNKRAKTIASTSARILDLLIAGDHHLRNRNSGCCVNLRGVIKETPAGCKRAIRICRALE